MQRAGDRQAPAMAADQLAHNSQAEAQPFIGSSKPAGNGDADPGIGHTHPKRAVAGAADRYLDRRPAELNFAALDGSFRSVCASARRSR
jgi:hypothetical protein